MLEAESGARAYVLSGDEHYLSAYIDGRTQAGDTLAALRTGFAADPGALAAVDALAEPVERRWLSLDQLVAGRGSGSVEAATLIAGSAITTDIRARIEALRAPLRTRMEGITRASFERSGQARGINSVLGVAIIALLLVIGGLAWRQEELRGRITALLRTENARLQAEVDARTAELTSLAGYLSETREAEHARLAAELHDEFGPLLSAVRMDAVWITRKLPAPLQHGLLQKGALQKQLRNLARLKYLVQLDGPIYYDAELYNQMVAAVLAGQQVGDLIDMASLKEITGLSRKYAIPFCLRMEMDGWVRREENERRVLRLPQTQDEMEPA